MESISPFSNVVMGDSDIHAQVSKVDFEELKGSSVKWMLGCQWSCLISSTKKLKLFSYSETYILNLILIFFYLKPLFFYSDLSACICNNDAIMYTAQSFCQSTGLWKICKHLSRLLFFPLIQSSISQESSKLGFLMDSP